ncbi:hypothetical protein UFOVP273_8 [uncultured Caudovirales phage]|uniref:Uncharacterized protein n=1 Tax=uncultured Caudovirales phage TaxID=2100421 RepID=A0A6J5LHI7_9CAUD|nr:hypothetical protein UFOVP273_8 [uncultured Caudovirales phage]
MSIALELFLKYWKQLVLSVLLVILLYTGYEHIKQVGYNEASTKYEAIIKDYNDKLDKRISTIETNSTQLVQAQNDAAAKIDQSIDQITVLAKKKPLYVVNQTGCIPSQNFLDSYNSVINRANGK